jgi:hypothetical protein
MPGRRNAAALRPRFASISATKQSRAEPNKTKQKSLDLRYYRATATTARLQLSGESNATLPIAVTATKGPRPYYAPEGERE